MAKIEPSKPRAQISDDRGGVRIVIPAKRRWPQILGLLVFLVAWIYGIISITRQHSNQEMPSNVSIAVMIVFSGLVFYTLLWHLVGKEIVTVDGQWLKTRREIGRWGRTHEYMLAQIRDLRASQGHEQPRFSSGMSGGTSIAFDYGAKTYRFAVELDEAEAKEIVRTIKNRFKIQDTSTN